MFVRKIHFAWLHIDSGTNCIGSTFIPLQTNFGTVHRVERPPHRCTTHKMAHSNMKKDKDTPARRTKPLIHLRRVPSPSASYEAAPYLPVSITQTMEDWPKRAKVKAGRGVRPNKEVYIIFAHAQIEGWVRLDAVPAQYRRTAAASAQRQDKLRAIRHEAANHSRGSAEGDVLPGAARECSSKGCEEALRPGAAHVGRIAPCEQLGCGRRVCAGCHDAVWDESYDESDRSILRAAIRARLPLAALEICRECAGAEAWRRGVGALPVGFKDCVCFHFAHGWGCGECRVRQVRSGRMWRDYAGAVRKWLLGKEGGCRCGRRLNQSGTWCCEECGGVVVKQVKLEEEQESDWDIPVAVDELVGALEA
ncbi:hypothetical protein ANO11243_011600 [Dothideomycetidae sp. 11243]|nr:hypothetical protein ANO11243_011600 [fungal sp. No.11243]